MPGQSASAAAVRASMWALLACVAPEAAAAEKPEAAPESTADENAGLQRIIVTARKVREDVQNVPAAVVTLGTEEVERFDVSSLEKTAALTPGLIITRGNSGSGASISLRGIGPNFSSIGIEQSVAVVVDGVYYGQGRVIDESFFDVAQIEILKGPQALYWGKNSTAGVVSITTENPGRQRELMARLGYEFKADERMLGFVVSGPVGEGVGLRLAVNARDMQGGYVSNEAPAGTYTTVDAASGEVATHAVPAPSPGELPRERVLAARLTATYKPEPTLELALKASADRRRSGSTSWNDRLWICPNDSNGEPCGEGFSVRQNPVPADIAATRPYMNRYGGQLYTLYESQGLTLRADKSFGQVTLSSITNYQHFDYSALSDYDFSATPAIWSDEHDRYHAYSQELRLNTSFDQPVNFMGGLYLQGTKLEFAQGSALFGADNSAAAPSDRYLAFSKDSATRGRTTAAYAQLSWNFMPGWEYVLGGRYTAERKTSYFVQPYVNPGFAVVYPPGARLDADQKFQDFSPATTLSWKPSSELTVYAGYKTGYKSGGFSNSATISAFGNGLADLAFGPESVKGIELGAKATLLDNRLRLSADAYRYRYSDLQIDFYDAQRLSLETTNAGSAVVKGVELAAEYLPPAISGLKLTGSAQYNLARYRDYIAPCYAGQTQAEGCLPTGANGALRQDLGGRPTANAPLWTASLGADHTQALGPAMALGLSARVRYSSSYSVSPFGQPLAVQPSYVNVDAAVRLAAADDRWQVALIGKNLGNTFVVSSAFDQSGTGSPSGGETGTPANQFGLFAPPRSVALELTARF
ncbi:TonB-dependent receptor [Ideonella sp. YS5]